MPVTATPWRMVPSTPARKTYLAWKALVSWAARAASWAWWTSRGCTVSWRRPDAEVVHWARTGQGRQVAFAKVITIVSVPRWATGFQELLAWPCGQVACQIGRSMVNLDLSNPWPALACGEVSASIGVTSAMPKPASEDTSRSAAAEPDFTSHYAA